MAECEWIVLCDYAFPSAHGKIGMIGVFDLIWSPSVPFKLDRAAIAFSIIGEPGEVVNYALEVIRPNGKSIVKGTSQQTLPDAGGARGLLEIRGLTMEEFGQHAIQMDCGDGNPKSAWFTLKQIQVQAP